MARPFDIVGHHVLAAVDQRRRLGRPVQTQRTARADARVQLVTTARQFHDVQHVVGDRVVHGHLANLALQLQNLAAIEHRRQVLHGFPKPMRGQHAALVGPAG